MEGETGKRAGLKCFGMQGADFREKRRVGKKGEDGIELIGRSEGETSTCDANKKSGRVTLVLYRTTPLVCPLSIVTLRTPAMRLAPLQRPKFDVEYVQSTVITLEVGACLENT